MNVLDILDRYHIEYVDSGKNVAKGNVNVQCPWCGAADHSQHLGINVATGMWGCWRDAQHRGRQLYRLLSKLTGISQQEARRATGEGVRRAVQLGDMERAVEGLQIAPRVDTDTGVTDLSLDRSFRKLCLAAQNTYHAETRFLWYLIYERRFRKKDIRNLAIRYKLRYCVTGDFADRLIIPVYENGKLMTYLGRSIHPHASLRYRALEKEKSVKQIKDCVYNYDLAMRGGEIVTIVEGAVDVWKVDFYNRGKGLRSIGLFNMNVEDSQLELLYDLRGRFDQYIILLDQGEVAKSLRLESQLSFLGNVKSQLLHQANDPGSLTPVQAKHLKKWL